MLQGEDTSAILIEEFTHLIQSQEFTKLNDMCASALKKQTLEKHFPKILLFQTYAQVQLKDLSQAKALLARFEKEYSGELGDPECQQLYEQVQSDI